MGKQTWRTLGLSCRQFQGTRAGTCPGWQYKVFFLEETDRTCHLSVNRKLPATPRTLNKSSCLDPFSRAWFQIQGIILAMRCPALQITHNKNIIFNVFTSKKPTPLKKRIVVYLFNYVGFFKKIKRWKIFKTYLIL